jgi:hypothetical protein
MPVETSTTSDVLYNCDFSNNNDDGPEGETLSKGEQLWPETEKSNGCPAFESSKAADDELSNSMELSEVHPSW